MIDARHPDYYVPAVPTVLPASWQSPDESIPEVLDFDVEPVFRITTLASRM